MKLVDRFVNSSFVRGALAGAVATVPMTVAMQNSRQLLSPLQRTLPLPPEMITADVERRSGLRRDLETHRTATFLSHFGYGAFCGLVYGLLVDRVRAKPAFKGPMFGFIVWAVSYLGWVPALRLSPAATRESSGRNAMMIISHLVCGASLSKLIQNSPRQIVSEAVTGAMGRDRTAKMVQHAFS